MNFRAIWTFWEKREIFRPSRNSSTGPSSLLTSQHTDCTTPAPFVGSDYKTNSEILSVSQFSDLVTTGITLYMYCQVVMCTETVIRVYKTFQPSQELSE
jgi:hypothetical protein